MDEDDPEKRIAELSVSWPTRNRRLTKANFARNQPTPAQRRNPRGFRHFRDSRLSGLLAETRNKFGDTMGHELMVYSDHAVIQRVDPKDSRAEITYRDTAVVELSKFDVSGVTATLANGHQRGRDRQAGPSAVLTALCQNGGDSSVSLRGGIGGK